MEVINVCYQLMNHPEKGWVCMISKKPCPAVDSNWHPSLLTDNANQEVVNAQKELTCFDSPEGVPPEVCVMPVPSKEKL